MSPTVMPYLRLFGPPGVMIASVTGIIITMFIANKIVRGAGKLTTVKVFFCILGLIIVIFVSVKVFMSDFSKPSEVDISPIAALSDVSFYDIEGLCEKMGRLEAVDGIERFRIRFHEAFSDGRVGECSYTMSYRDIPASASGFVSVYISIYDIAENARKSYDINEKNTLFSKKRNVTVSENIEAILFHSKLFRAADQLGMYSDKRKTETIILMGNILIDIWESKNTSYEIGVLSSKNIAIICEVLFENGDMELSGELRNSEDSGILSITNTPDAADESSSERIYEIWDDWDDFPFENMHFAGDEAVEFLKTAFGKVDFYGEFAKGNVDDYDFYLEKYNQLIRNEIAFIDQTRDEEMCLDSFGYLAGYLEGGEIKTGRFENMFFYFFDMDEDGAPELCISSEGIFKYDPDLGKCILWGGFMGNDYYSIKGSRKIAWEHPLASSDAYEFYQYNTEGKIELSVFFFAKYDYEGRSEQDEHIYVVSAPIYANKYEQIEITEEIEQQAYSYYVDNMKVHCFRLSKEQYEELTKDFFVAGELAREKLKEVSFTYDELFGRLSNCTKP